MINKVFRHWYLAQKHRAAFTIIELLLYIGIASVILLATSVFLFTLLQSRVKNQTIGEVEQQGLQAMQLITNTIRNAQSISSPVQGTSANTISLYVLDGLKNPTVFDLSGGTIRITEGASGAIPLTNGRIIVSSLTFQNLSRPNTSGTVRIVFTLTHKNPQNRIEYSYMKTFTGSATLRLP